MGMANVSSKFGTAACVLRLAVVDRRRIANVEQ